MTVKKMWQVKRADPLQLNSRFSYVKLWKPRNTSLLRPENQFICIYIHIYAYPNYSHKNIPEFYQLHYPLFHCENSFWKSNEDEDVPSTGEF